MHGCVGLQGCVCTCQSTSNESENAQWKLCFYVLTLGEKTAPLLNYYSHALPTKLPCQFCQTSPLLNDMHTKSQSHPGHLKACFHTLLFPDTVLNPLWANRYDRLRKMGSHTWAWTQDLQTTFPMEQPADTVTVSQSGKSPDVQVPFSPIILESSINFWRNTLQKKRNINTSLLPSNTLFPTAFKIKV